MVAVQIWIDQLSALFHSEMCVVLFSGDCCYVSFGDADATSFSFPFGLCIPIPL